MCLHVYVHTYLSFNKKLYFTLADKCKKNSTHVSTSTAAGIQIQAIINIHRIFFCIKYKHCRQSCNHLSTCM